ncbi:hypothetical protein scyTo_0019137 [Scyliorhinus torazame]|uniref:Uncharacterized protein n=1 Tax=Scyliorhinus torazame TaxID=75743 RepID=A0A401PTH2_SCYTO|nr:hypothetical protein [Scyliorhinus torazame]
MMKGMVLLTAILILSLPSPTAASPVFMFHNELCGHNNGVIHYGPCPVGTRFSQASFGMLICCVPDGLPADQSLHVLNE